MRCVYLVSHGRADSMVVDARPDPIPQPGEVVVKISAAALNRVDLYMRSRIPSFYTLLCLANSSAWGRHVLESPSPSQNRRI